MKAMDSIMHNGVHLVVLVEIDSQNRAEPFYFINGDEVELSPRMRPLYYNLLQGLFHNLCQRYKASPIA